MHVLVRNRQFDLIGVIHDNTRRMEHDGPATFRPVGGLFYFLRPGDTYDLKTREPSRPGAGASALGRVVKKAWPKP